MKRSEIPNMKTVNGEMRAVSDSGGHNGLTRVNKYVYIVLAIFLGVFGIHQFYAKKIRRGVLYLLFCWTLIPELLAFIDAVRACGMLRDEKDDIWL